MFSGVCDMLDGRVASLKSRTNREKKYGIQIDSLADIISFGVFPVVIGYAVGFEDLNQYFGSFGIVIGTAILSTYLLAALIRLAYFNVIEEELQANNQNRLYYEGLPTTSVALIIPIVCSISMIFNASLSTVYTILLIILTVLFVAKIRIPKPKGRSQFILILIGLPVVIYILLCGGIFA